MQISKKELADQEIEFTVTADSQDIDQARAQALVTLGQEINIPGFRKGHAPTGEIVKRVGELRLMQEIVEEVIEAGYHQILEQYDVFPLSTPKIDLKDDKKADEEISFTATITVRPTVELPDYKNLNVSYEEPVVTPEQTEEALKELFNRWKDDLKKSEDEKPVIETATSLKEAEIKAEDDKKGQDTKLIAASKDNPDDEWSQLLGAQNLEDLRQKLHANLILEKHYMSGNKFTQDILNKLIEKVKVNLPNKLINEDLEKRIAQKEEDLDKVGLSLESFSKQQKTTVDQVRKDWLGDIEKEYTLEFALAEIAQKENITVSDEEVQNEIKASQSADSLKVFQDSDRREHLRYLIRRDKIIRKLVEWNFPQPQKEDNVQNS
jgi:trigger factor